MLQSSKLFDFKIWGFLYSLSMSCFCRNGVSFGESLFFLLFFFFYLFNFKFSRVIINDKRAVFTEVVKSQSLCDSPSGQSFGSGTFFNKDHL